MEPEFREVLILRDVEDMSYEEIAEVTGLADGTVKSRIHRARLQLSKLSSSPSGRKSDDPRKRQARRRPPEHRFSRGLSRGHRHHDFEQENVRSILKHARFTERRGRSAARVQRRIRERSRGSFYGDGWSRSRSATSTYVVTSILMLASCRLVYLVLVPEFRLTP